MKLTLIATTIMGLEAVLKREILALGFDQVKVFDTKVEFKAEVKDICRANLWLRTAGRVYVKIAEFKATSFDELYEKTKDQPWSEWIQKNDQFPVTKVSSRKSILFSKSDSQAVVKKAVVDALKKGHNVSHLPEDKELFPIRIQIEKDWVTLSIDTSGEGLNKRGYRAHMDKAPLRETLAAGLVLLSRWRPDKEVLIDPLCGSGTICIEAALIAQNKAPGMHRKFVSEGWERLSTSDWNQAREAAKAVEKTDPGMEILGFDQSAKAIDIAKKNSEIARVGTIIFKKKPVSQLNPPCLNGVIISNPPYGQRLSDQVESEALYEEMGAIFKERFETWSAHMLTSSESFEKCFKKTSSKHRKLYNGGMKCWFYQFFAPRSF